MYYNNIRKRPLERPILSPFTEDHPRASPQQLQQAQESMRQRQQRFPKLTNLKYFETNMVQETIQLHDRYMLQAHAYMRKWMDQPHDEWKYPNIASTNNNNNTPQQQQQQKVCVVIQTSHRVIPYIFSLLYSILSGHSPNEWHAVFQTHLLHSEHRPARLPYTLFEQSLKHIPLFHQVHYAPNTTDPNDYAKNIMRDTIHALQICQQANLTWCLVLEDDAVVMPHLATVLPELLSSSSNTSWQTANVSQISLYAYYNTIRLKHLARLENPDYAAQYERDVNPYHPRPTPYFLHPAVHPAGTVANMYHGKYVPALIAYLQSWLHPAEASGKSVQRNVDVYISNPELFLQTSHSQRWQTTPSLVNHVGFYSERMENVHDLTSQLATDVRFRLEVEQSQSNDEGWRKNHTRWRLSEKEERY